MKVAYPAEWRPKSKWKRRLYSKYMTWLERAGYIVVILVIGAFIYAFNFKVDDLITADKVKIEPAASVLSATEVSKVVEVLVKDHQEVTNGDVLLRYVKGESAIRQYNAWEAAQVLRKQTTDPTQVQSLTRYIKPSVTDLVATDDGTVRVSETLAGMQVEADGEFARILDFSDLRMSPSLAGQTVAAATTESPVQITALTVEPKDGIIFRGSGTMPVISGQLIGAEFKDVLKKELRGKSIKARDDRPLEIVDVNDVQIDASVSLTPATKAVRSQFLDPPTTTLLKGKVLSGTHGGILQLASLPPDVQQALYAEVRQEIEGAVVTSPTNTSYSVSEAVIKNMVLKVKAAGEGRSDSPIPASSINRTFDAQVQIDNPPPHLVRAVRLADQQGKAVTAKVELKTGNRPIAFILLKKS